MSGQLIRLLNTARHLRARQVCSRVRQHVRSALPLSSGNGNRRAPVFPGCRWHDSQEFLPPAFASPEASDLSRGVFHFLNRRDDLGFPPRWDGIDQPKLWLYNLHYFDWLWHLDCVTAKRAVLDWIERHDNRPGRIGWESYPLSVRLVNWCSYFLGSQRHSVQNDPVFLAALWGSLFQQGSWLSNHLETHLLNNHYLENGAALVFAGTCFQGDDARHWLDRGMRILSEQIAEQILPDGMHFELSPMYHCRILYVLSLLAASQDPALTELLSEAIGRMRRALRYLCHPDGDIALFNDSAQGIVHDPVSLLEYTRRYTLAVDNEEESLGSFALPDAGYYGWRGDDGTYLVADYGRIGPDHNPGHGHADTFGFELSLRGHRVTTDCGVHDYEDSAMRRYSRSTAAHSTVEIAGQDQCELWGAFRVARRGYPLNVRWRGGESGFVLSGEHDGYTRLPGSAMHKRTMQWDAADGLLIEDMITASHSVDAVSRLHLHPVCRVVDCSESSARISYPAGSFRVEANMPIDVEQTAHFPRFYQQQERPCLRISGRGESIRMEYRIRI